MNTSEKTAIASDLQQIKDLLKCLVTINALCKIKYGNLDSDVWEEIQKADELIDKVAKDVKNRTDTNTKQKL